MSTVGKLRLYFDRWLEITNDQWVLDVIAGLKIPFVSEPFQIITPNEIPFPPDQWEVVDKEVNSLLEKGAIVRSNEENSQFISTIFIVPKPGGKFRPVINLRFLNEFIEYNHFKQETFRVILDIVQRGDWFTKLDMTDGYFHISIHPLFQKYLKFRWNGMLYHWVCLPFGLSCAPFVFTKILKPVFTWFRAQNIRCGYYIDDSLNMNQDRVICQENCTVMVDTLTSLGFTMNQKKSVTTACQKIVFFGFILDSVAFKVFLTEDKIQKIICKAEALLRTQQIVVRDLASFIGSVINAFDAVYEAQLHYRCLERDKILGLGQEMNFDNQTILSCKSKEEIHWWLNNVNEKNGKWIRPPDVQIRCRTDASLEGFGGIDIDTDLYTSGRWSAEEAVNHINYLELLAIFYTLQALFSDKRQKHIEVQSDSVSAVAYVNNFGGMQCLKMDKLAADIWLWCINRGIHLSAVHIPGSINTADFYSRNFSESTEWQLKRSIFVRLCKQYFTPDVDLFASRLNKQLDCFVSWFPEPGAFAVNAFSLSWSGFSPFLFPPFNLVGKVLNKVVQDRVEKALIVLPYWPSQSYFPIFLENLCSFPVRIPRHGDLLTLVHSGESHPLGRNLQLIAAVVSGKPCRVQDFRQTLLGSSLTHGQVEHVSSMTVLGESGICGHILGQAVRFSVLKR